MAIHEFFQNLGEEQLSGPASMKKVEAMTLFQEAGQLVAGGDIDEAKQRAEMARGLDEQARVLLDRYQQLLEVFVPAVIVQLRTKYGIFDENLGEEDPANRDVAAQVASEGSIVDTSFSKVDTKGASEKSETRISRHIRAFSLTDKQHKVAKARFRLIDEERDEVTYDEAINEVYADELQHGEDPKVIKRNAYTYWYNQVIGKLEAGVRLVTTDGDELRLPFTDEQLANLNDSAPLTVDLFRQLSAVETYQGLTLSELINYVSGSGPVRLKKQDQQAIGEEVVIEDFNPTKSEDIPELVSTVLEPITGSGEGVVNISKGQRRKREPADISVPQEPEREPSPHTLTTEELYFLASRVWNQLGNSLVAADQSALEEILEHAEDQGADKLPVDTENLRTKLEALTEDVATLYDAQDERGQLLVAILTARQPQELQELLRENE